MAHNLEREGIDKGHLIKPSEAPRGAAMACAHVMGITVHSHADLESLLEGFNQAYNRRQQRVLDGASPEQVLQQRLALNPDLANSRAKRPIPMLCLRLSTS
jgi:hypothetical protein